MGLASLLFFMWGFVTVLNDILIPHFKAAFDLSATEAMLVQFCFFGAYFTIGLPAGRLVGRIGYRWGIVVGLVVAGLGALAFLPAASGRTYAGFLVALFILASGITVLQVAANPFVTLLGPPRTAASRLNLAQGINSVGTTIAPLLGAWLILDASGGAADLGSVRGPYLVIAAILLGMSGLFAAIRLPDGRPSGPAPRPIRGGLLGERRLLNGTVAIFLYVGAEVGIGSVLVLFFGQEDVAGMSEQLAGYHVAYYWGAAMVGRFVGAAISRRVEPAGVLAVASVVAVLLISVTVVVRGEVAVWTLLAVGFTNAVMFPTIFALAVEGLGERTGEGSGMLVMAIVGGAVVPVVMGALADAFGFGIALASTTLCYAFVGQFAISCWPARTRQTWNESVASSWSD